MDGVSTVKPVVEFQVVIMLLLHSPSKRQNGKPHKNSKAQRYFTYFTQSISQRCVGLHRIAVAMDCGGFLQSQVDSYQTESINKVISCEKCVDSENFAVILDDSVLYPEGGGQPWDLGFVNDVRVVKVLKCPGQNKHIQVDLEAPLEVGTLVKSVVNWERRYDFMQQHTAQV